MNVSQARDKIDVVFGNPLDVISSCLRGFLWAKPGHTLIGADFSSIEARVLAWLAGEEEILEVFRTHGKIYEVAAAEIYNVSLKDVTKVQRQIGKIGILSLGYGGGKGAFQQMAKGYGVKVSDDEAEGIKVRWREANKKIVRFWYALEEAAFNAVRMPGKTFKAKSISFKMSGSFLWCRLPSSRVLCYPYPQIKLMMKRWGTEKETLTYMAVDPLTKKWERCETYGGSLAENVTQAVARDIMAESIVRLELNGYPVIMHAHDEITCEVRNDYPWDIHDFERVMSTNPEWCSDLPIKAEGWAGVRYQK